MQESQTTTAAVAPTWSEEPLEKRRVSSSESIVSREEESIRSEPQAPSFKPPQVSGVFPPTPRFVRYSSQQYPPAPEAPYGVPGGYGVPAYPSLVTRSEFDEFKGRVLNQLETVERILTRVEAQTGAHGRLFLQLARALGAPFAAHMQLAPDASHLDSFKCNISPQPDRFARDASGRAPGRGSAGPKYDARKKEVRRPHPDAPACLLDSCNNPCPQRSDGTFHPFCCTKHARMYRRDPTPK